MAVGKMENIELIKQGAEARLYRCRLLDRDVVIKERFVKKYRHAQLDSKLTGERMKSEVRNMLRCRQAGVQTPLVLFVDVCKRCIYMEYITDSVVLRDHIETVRLKHPETWQERLANVMRKVGQTLAQIHESNIIHGDLTTSNMLLRDPPDAGHLVLIDFGLSSISATPLDKGIDIYVLEKAFISSHANSEQLFDVIIESYAQHSQNGGGEVIEKFKEVRLSGRKRSMVG